MTEVPGTPSLHNITSAEQSAEAAAVHSGSPGAMLESKRAERGLTVADVALRLKYGARQIEALERDDYAHLPGTTFVRGMIRGYARLLEIDPAPVLAEWDRRCIPAQVSVDLRATSIPFPVASKRSNKVYGFLSLIIVIAVALVIFESQFSGLGWLFSPDQKSARNVAAPNTVPLSVPLNAIGEGPGAGLAADQSQATNVPLMPSPTQTEATTAVVPNSAATALPSARAPAQPLASAAGAPPAVQGGRASSAAIGAAIVPPIAASSDGLVTARRSRLITLHFDRDSWVEIKQSNGKILMSQLNRGGTDQVVEGTPPFDIIIGNAPSVRLTYNNVEVDLRPYFKVDVARLTLD